MIVGYYSTFTAKENLEKALEILKNGGIILYPSDTGWSIGCDATHPEAIQKVKQLKGKEMAQPLIILVESERRLQDLVEVPETAWEIIDLTDKPITLIYEDSKNLPAEILAEDGSIGIRLVKDDFCKKLIGKLNKPLVCTSARWKGEKRPLKFSDIPQQLLDAVDYVVEENREKTAQYVTSSLIKIWKDSRVKVLRE